MNWPYYLYFQITINEQSGINFIELLATTLDTLSLCIDFKVNSLSSEPSASTSQDTDAMHHKQMIKLIDEILQYLNILIDYAPIESIECLRQLQKFMFKRNLGSYVHGEYRKFNEVYKNGIIHGTHKEIFRIVRASLSNESSSIDEKFAKDIKLFEPMVVYCLTVSIKLDFILLCGRISY